MSQFSKLFEAVKDNSKQENAKVKKPKRNLTSAIAGEAETALKTKTTNSAEPSKPNREKQPRQKEKRAGKSSSAEHTQVLTYIRRDTHKRIKMALMDDARDLSDLMEELLTKWLCEAK